jgi:tetratricopeptide (TPR) repeat protein
MTGPAIVADEALYKSLAAAATVEEAVRAAQQEMIRRHLLEPRDCPDWHLLRMYRDDREVGALVTPLREKGREKLQRNVAEKEFLDEKGEIKVANRAGFVGRRRPLQRCLQAMQETSEHIGVYSQGMGGLGKSTLAARICTRVRGLRNQFEQVVIVGPLDEQRLLNGLSNKYERHAQIPALLNQPQMSLQGRLQNFFEAIENALDKPLLLVLDDFEQNIPKQNVENGSLRLTVEAYDVLGAICEALGGKVSRLVVTCRYYAAATLPPSSGGLHVEELYRMSEADVAKKQRLIEQKQTENRQPLSKATMAEIVEASEGNPRLLEWLTAAAQEQLTSTSLLLKLRETEEAFRENVLATALLAALTPAEQKGLARLSSVWLPIEIALMPEMMWEGAAEQSLNRLAGLGLVEKSEQGTQPTAAYRVSRILEPVLLPVLSEAEWQAAHRAMAQKLYQVWWEGSDTSSESQRLEIVRLASLAEEQEIAAVVGDALANHWYSNSRFVESLDFCQRFLTTFEDYRILGTIAKSESVLGEVDEALRHYQRALDLCPEEDFGDKAATLNNMAGVIAQQGDIERALQLWQESLDIKERIGDVKGKAATLANLAYWAGETGDRTKQLNLNLQATEALGQARAYSDLLTVLGNLGLSSEDSGLAYLAQAIWLLLRIQAPLPDSIHLLNALYQRIPKGDPLEALLGTTALFFCQTRGENHPQLQPLQKTSFNILIGAATEQGIDPNDEASLQNWITAQQLNDPALFLPQLNAQLETLIGETWAFDRTPLLG